MLNTIQKYYDKFEDWVHSWWPGAKTRMTAAAGFISMVAASTQEYISGLPTTKWISQETLSIVAAVLFSLSFWFSNMGARVQAREE